MTNMRNKTAANRSNRNWKKTTTTTMNQLNETKWIQCEQRLRFHVDEHVDDDRWVDCVYVFLCLQNGEREKKNSNHKSQSILLTHRDTFSIREPKQCLLVSSACILRCFDAKMNQIDGMTIWSFRCQAERWKKNTSCTLFAVLNVHENS